MTKRMTKRLVIGSLIGLLVLAAVVTGASGAQKQAKKAKVTKIIVADAPTTHHLNLYVAQEKGLFKKHGVEVEIIEVKDLAAARDAVVAGKADVFWSCPTVAIAAIGGGAPIKLIAQVKKPCTSVLLVPPNSPIQELKDLNGKKIGGISPTCEAVVSITKAAKKAGAKFDLEKLPGGPAIAALEAGRVDGAILEEPHASIAELKGFKVLFRGISDDIPCRTINASTSFLKDNPEALRNMVKAVDEANKIILKDPKADEIVDIAEKYTRAPKEAIKNGNPRLKFRVLLDEKGLVQLGNDLVELGNIKKNPGENLFAPDFKGITWGLK